MSVYYNFRKCTVCRSNKIREEYRGEYGVTMLINTMYLTVLQQLEKPKDSGIEANILVPHLVQFGCIIDKCGNEFYSHDIMRYLRNGLAHFNIVVTPDCYGNIERIVIYALKKDEVDIKTKPLRCQVYGTEEDIEIPDVICSFDFSIKGLEKFTDYVIDKVYGEKTQECSTCTVMMNHQNSESQLNQIKEKV